MAQLWGGRFTKETDKLVYNFNASISFDKRFYEQDIQGSKAHVMMLAKQGILTDDEKQQILDGLESIRRDVESRKLEITEEYEDIHSFVEANLIDRIGDAGQKLHTGRRDPRDRRPGKGTSGSDPSRDGGKCRDIHAWIHTPSESAADHTGTPYGCLF